MAEIKQRILDTPLDSFKGDAPGWLKRVLLVRGVSDFEQLDSDLSRLHSPNLMSQMDSAVELLTTAIRENQNILIMGDYDADGATSCALAVRALRAMGAKSVDFLVPDRFKFGYGLSPEIVEVASQRAPDLLVTVDNGISSIEGVERAKALNIKVLITDHHLPGDQLPAADAIINPNQHGCAYPSKNLAGVGVLFSLLLALRTSLRSEGWFEDSQIAEPNMGQWLDIVALGTVADLVPLDDNNRLLVSTGVKRIRSGKGNPGIRALFEVAGKQYHLAQSTDLGFVVGPRINASGRLHDISLGVQCLLTDDEDEARRLAMQLHEINQDRRVIEQQMRQEAETAVDSLDLDEKELPWGLCLYQKDWHAGVVGLIASRIKDRWHRPTLVFAAEGADKLKGSGRSIKGFHLRDALEAIATKNPDLIEQYGGHAMAAGLSIKSDRYEEIVKAFDHEVKVRLGEDELIETLLTDGELPAQALSLVTAKILEEIAPWGQAFSEPLFEGDFVVESARILNETHLKMQLKSSGTKNTMEAIWFGTPAEYIGLKSGDKGRFLYQLQVNRYRGMETAQLMVRGYLPN